MSEWVLARDASQVMRRGVDAPMPINVHPWATPVGVSLAIAVAMFHALGYAKSRVEKAYQDAKKQSRGAEPTPDMVQNQLQESIAQSLKEAAPSTDSEIMEPVLARRILAEFKALNTRRKKELRDQPDSKFQQLTPREETMLKMVTEGKPNKIIARDLEISENTVRNHLANVFDKLQVNNRTEAAVMASKNTREPIEGVAPKEFSARDAQGTHKFPAEFKVSRLEKPQKQDLSTLQNVGIALQELNNQLGPYGKATHAPEIYTDAIDAVHSALLSWKEPDLDKAAELTQGHKFGEAKKIVDRVTKVATENHAKVAKRDEKAKKNDRPLEELVAEKATKVAEYRRRDFEKRRQTRFYQKIMGLQGT